MLELVQELLLKNSKMRAAGLQWRIQKISRRRRLGLIGLALFVLIFTNWSDSSAPAEIRGRAACILGGSNYENIVVFLTGPSVSVPRSPRKPAVIDQRGLRFSPHVLPVVPGTTVAFPNSDPIRHNVFSASEVCLFNLGIYGPGITRTITLNRTGVVEVLCNVHPEMLAYILVLDTLHLTRLDRRGCFQFTKITPGRYQLNFWCEHRGFIARDLVVRGGQIRKIEAMLHRDEVKENGRTIPLRPKEN